MERLNKTLKQHDINIRTVDNILFDTREEASIARTEFQEIISIRNKVTKNSEESINAAIDEINNNNYVTVIKNRHLEELNNELVAAIRFADNLFLNENYSLSSINTEEQADKAVDELESTTLRNMDLLEARLSEIRAKREQIIEDNDRAIIENYLSTTVILIPDDITRTIQTIRASSIRTEKVKDEKVWYIVNNADNIMRKHNELLEKALKYEIRINTVNSEKKTENKGIFGFFSKAIEKGTSFIDGMQEKKEKEAWDFITNNGTRTIESVRNYR